MSRGSSTIDLTALAHARMILIDPDGALAERGTPSGARALLAADSERFSTELRQYGMRAEPAGPDAPQVPGVSRLVLAALAALPTVRLLTAVTGEDPAACGYLAVLADNDLRAIERDQRLIRVLIEH